MSGKCTSARAMARCQAWLNTIDYLWQANLGLNAGSTRVVPLRHTRPPHQVLPHLTLDSVPWGSAGGMLLQG
jgi:hypothetical protein